MSTQKVKKWTSLSIPVYTESKTIPDDYSVKFKHFKELIVFWPKMDFCLFEELFTHIYNTIESINTDNELINAINKFNLIDTIQQLFDLFRKYGITKSVLTRTEINLHSAIIFCKDLKSITPNLIGSICPGCPCLTCDCARMEYYYL